MGATDLQVQARALQKSWAFLGPIVSLDHQNTQNNGLWPQNQNKYVGHSLGYFGGAEIPKGPTSKVISTLGFSVGTCCCIMVWAKTCYSIQPCY